MFPVRATAQQVRRVVAADLVAAVRGKPLAEARTALEAYGTTTIDLWPGFVSSIPSYDFRIDLTVRGAPPVEEASPGPGSSGASPGATRSATPRPPPSASPKPEPERVGQALGQAAGSLVGERRHREPAPRRRPR